MQIIADVSKVSKNLQLDLTLFKMFFQNLRFILPSFQEFLLKRMFLVSHKVVFIENEAVFLCASMQERAGRFVAAI